jgi:hypothetical protein
MREKIKCFGGGGVFGSQFKRLFNAANVAAQRPKRKIAQIVRLLIR